MKTSEPIPAASNPGRRTRGSIAPPNPAASMMITAPTTGDPKSEETAAKLPAAAIKVRACWGASFLASFMARNPRPPPMAISGASGPSTSPSPIVASAARRMPGS